MRCNKFEGKRGIEDDIIPREDTATPNQQTWLRSTTPPGDFHPQPLPLSISQPNSNRITFRPSPSPSSSHSLASHSHLTTTLLATYSNTSLTPSPVLAEAKNSFGRRSR